MCRTLSTKAASCPLATRKSHIANARLNATAVISQPMRRYCAVGVPCPNSNSSGVTFQKTKNRAPWNSPHYTDQTLSFPARV
jgi:hypothetical protein